MGQFEGPSFLVVCGTTEQVAEKGQNMGRISQERPSVAKAKALFCRTYGTTEVVPFQSKEFFRSL
jgi:hypothetical protein